MKKTIITVIFITAMLSMALVIGLTKAGACAWWGCAGGGTYLQEQQAIEDNQKRLMSIEPLPKMTDSEERKNLIKRAKTFNNPNKISYIYLYSFDGKLIMYDTVKGKVSALDSSLTGQQQFVDSGGKLITNSNNCLQSNDNCFAIPAPAVDGSYGTNGAGIFYFNENGAYREWNGTYILSDQPFVQTQQPDLVKQVK